jgi:hypothetical protein
MTSLAAELTDRVIPFVPVRQFVLSLPHRLRYRLAYDHSRSIAVLRIFIRTVMSFYRRRGLKRGVRNGRTGSVTFLQRFGSAANCNLHFHVVMLDGVFAEDAHGELFFHAAEPPTEAELEKLVDSVRTRVLRHLDRQGDWDGDHGDTDPICAEAPVLASCYAGSIAGRHTLGRRRGARLQRIGADPDAPWASASRPLQVQLEGFDLHAARAVSAQHSEDRQRLEALLRYCARPPISDERLRFDVDGNVVLRLKTPWRDGSTHVVYDPLDFVAKLAALVPRPHKNLVIYHGVLAANAAWRARAVAYGRQQAPGVEDGSAACAADESVPCLSRHLRRQWAELMRRSFGFDVLSCGRCGGKLRLLAVILERAVIRKILSHIGLPSEPPTPTVARAPPELDLPFDEFA